MTALAPSLPLSLLPASSAPLDGAGCVVVIALCLAVDRPRMTKVRKNIGVGFCSQNLFLTKGQHRKHISYWDVAEAKQSQGRGKFRPGTISLGKISPALKSPKLQVPSTQNDCNNTTRHAPDRDSKIATHPHNKEGQYLQHQSPDRQHQISYVCATNGWLRRVHERLALLRKHNPSAAVAKDGSVLPKFRRGEFSPPLLTAEFSHGKISLPL